MFLSYAQNLEDYYLSLVFPADRPGTYVDVGGGHPVADNVTFHFYLAGWRGLVVEPQERLASAYGGIRPRDTVVAHLAGKEDGEIDFHVVAGMHGLSSAVRQNADSVRKLGADYSTVRKTVRRLSRLFDEAAITDVDVLKIDVEGAEPDVIAGVDWRRHRPRIVLVEAVNPNNPDASPAAWEPALLAAGYRHCFFDNLNRYYVAGECAELAARFPAEPAPWDRVTHLWDWGRAGDRPAHPDRKLADVLAAGLYAELGSLAATHPGLLERLVARGLDAVNAEGSPGRGIAITDLADRKSAPGSTAAPTDLQAVLRDDAFRAALGRIACMYDGGHLLV